MKNTVIAAFAVALGLAFTASAHAAAGKTLAEIHGAAFPEASGWVKKDQCMKCHGSYEDLAKKTAGPIKSSGVPQRAAGVLATMNASNG